MFPTRIAIASRNPGKIREILSICSDWPVQWTTAEESDRPWPEIEETGSSYRENAMLKARAVAEATGVDAVADDSGIEVDALGGKPGLHSARFAGPTASDAENLHLLIRSLQERADAPRTARYRCVALLASPDGRSLHSEETCEGRLTTSPAGSGGFGYDPAFVPVGFDRTMAELSSEEKDAVSHRGKAFRALRALIDQRW